ncbi:hypothetical protein [Phaffia rhodozyma]|uniref:Uncharacterized protein n=1 Tax=Phaffia rhodozyma TaxID=264483 RepID=A0A0F7SYA9_PHARH|nr:hypothetical protein [Phaffia rhodozyma]
MSGLPPSTLYPTVFALASSIVIVLFIGLSMGVRQQRRREQRRLVYQLAYEERMALYKERARPDMFEVGGGKGRWAGTEQVDCDKINVDLPISALVLPHHPGVKVLPSVAPPVMICVIILQPKPPISDFPETRGEPDEEEEGLGVDVDLGMETINVVGDWRGVTRQAGLGFE